MTARKFPAVVVVAFGLGVVRTREFIEQSEGEIAHILQLFQSVRSERTRTRGTGLSSAQDPLTHVIKRSGIDKFRLTANKPLDETDTL